VLTKEAALSITIRRNDAQSRYEIAVDEQLVGVADFDFDGEVLVFPHTEIVTARRGEGLGDRLIQAALDDVRSRGERVRAECWFVRDFIHQHQEYADLLA
jgi:predicted GNAT family acetyltransferase